MNTDQARAQRQWYLVDAQGQILGRMASEIAKILRGKNKPLFTPNTDAGDFVVVINAKGIRLTGKKTGKENILPAHGISRRNSGKDRGKDAGRQA
jgi:ribosomal protein L13